MRWEWKNPWAFTGREFDHREAGGGKKGLRYANIITATLFIGIFIVQYKGMIKPMNEKYQKEQEELRAKRKAILENPDALPPPPTPPSKMKED